MSEQRADDSLSSAPLPDISTVALYAQSQDPAWVELSPEETATRLSSWSSDPSALLADIPAEACLAAVTQLSNQQSGQCKAILAVPLNQLLHKAALMLGNSNPCAVQDLGSDSSFIHGLLAAAFLASQRLLLTALPTAVSRPGRTAQWTSSTHSHQTAYRCLVAVCTAVHHLLVVCPYGLELHTAVSKVVRAVMVHHVLSQTGAKGSTSKSKQPQDQPQPMALTKLHLQELLAPLLLVPNAPGPRATASCTTHSAEQPVVDLARAMTAAEGEAQGASTGSFQEGTAQCIELLQQTVLNLLSASSTVGATGGGSLAMAGTSSSTSAVLITTAVNVIAGTMNAVAQQDTLQAIGLLMGVSDLLLDDEDVQRQSAAALRHPSARSPSAMSESALPVVQILATVATGFGDPVVAGMLLRTLQTCSGHSKAAVRKLVLDIAALALDASTVAGAEPLASMAAASLHAGTEDRDATVRAHALAAYMGHIPALWVQHAQQQQQQQHETAARQQVASKKISRQSILLRSVVPAVCARMLDTTKTLRLKATQLLLQLLSSDTSSVPANAVQPSVLAAGQKAVARSALSPLCSLLDARLDGPLYDPSIAQVLKDGLQQVLHHLGEAELLQQLLATAVPGNTGPQAAIKPTQLEHTALPAMSPGLMRTLLQQCQPADAAVACEVWCQQLSKLTSLDQVNALCQLAKHVPALKRLSIKQEAVRHICVALAQQPDTTSLETKASLATTCTSYLQAVYCFADCGMHQPVDCTAQTGRDVCSSDVACEAAIFLDLARHLLSNLAPHIAIAVAGTGEIPQQAHKSDGDLHSRQGNSTAVQACLAWCFHAVRKLVQASATFPKAISEHYVPAEPCPLVVATTSSLPGQPIRAASRPGATIDHLVLRLLKTGLREVLSSCSLDVIDAALQLLCTCKGAALHTQQVLQQLEQRLQLHKVPGTCAVQCTPADATHAPSHNNEVNSHSQVDGLGTNMGGAHAGLSSETECRGTSTVLSTRQLVIYLLLLGHMAQLYQQERQHAMYRARHARQLMHGTSKPIDPSQAAVISSDGHGIKSGKQQGCSQVAATDLDAVMTKVQSNAGPAQFNYMAEEEGQQAAQAMAQQYIEQLVGRSAPGTRAPLLAGLLCQLPKPLPAGLQALALRALCQLMVISPHLAAQHQHLVVACFAQPGALSGKHHCQWAAGELQEQEQQQQQKEQRTGWSVLCEEALKGAQALMLQHPNTCGTVLLVAVESLLSALLEATPPQTMTGHGSMKCKEKLQLRQVECVEQHRVMVRAMTMYVEVLCSDKLQLAGSTWRLLAKCVLSSHDQVKQLACDGLRTLLSLLPGRTTAQHIKGRAKAAGRKAVTTAGFSGRGEPQGPAGVMLLFANCEESERQRLVEEVILGLQLVSEDNVHADALVLPALQSLELADTAAARTACLTLLSHLTPSATAVAALASSVQSQSLGLTRMTPTQGLAVLNTLSAFVSRYKPAICATSHASCSAAGSDKAASNKESTALVRSLQQLSDAGGEPVTNADARGPTTAHTTSHNKLLAQLQALTASIQARQHASGHSSGIPRPCARPPAATSLHNLLNVTGVQASTATPTPSRKRGAARYSKAKTPTASSAAGPTATGAAGPTATSAAGPVRGLAAMAGQLDTAAFQAPGTQHTVTVARGLPKAAASSQEAASTLATAAMEPSVSAATKQQRSTRVAESARVQALKTKRRPVPRKPPAAHKRSCRRPTSKCRKIYDSVSDTDDSSGSSSSS